MSNRQYPGTPRWVKLAAGVGGILIVVLAIFFLTGGPDAHGPGRHFRDAPSSSAPSDASAG